MATPEATRNVLQPIHPDLLPRLIPEYAAYHRTYIQHNPYLHELPWNPAVRLAQVVPGSSVPLDVGSIKDYQLGKFPVRVYTPEGTAPAAGWPVFIFFHGGISKVLVNWDAQNSHDTLRWMGSREHRDWRSGLHQCMQG